MDLDVGIHLILLLSNIGGSCYMQGEMQGAVTCSTLDLFITFACNKK